MTEDAIIDEKVAGNEPDEQKKVDEPIDEPIKDNDTKITPEYRGSLGSMLDRLKEDAEKAGVKINPIKKEGEEIPLEKKNETPDKSSNEPEYDYSHFADIGDKEYQEIDKFLEEHNIKDPAIRHRLAMRENDYKKQHRLTSEREKQLNELKEVGTIEVDRKFEDIVNGFKEDFFTTYDKLQREYELPDLSTIGKQLAEGNTLQGQMKQYQSNVLSKEIEKEFNLEDGTFVFDPAEAWESGTPSYEFRVRTAAKENELRQEYAKAKQREQQVLEDIIKLREQQVKEIKEQYFPVGMEDDGSEEYQKAVQEADSKFQSYMNKLDKVYEEIQKGNTTTPYNPFIFKNVFRGVFFDDLMSKEIERVSRDIHRQYNEKGLYLMDKTMPEDVTNIQGKPVESDNNGFTVKGSQYSPQTRFLKRVSNEVKNKQ